MTEDKIIPGTRDVYMASGRGLKFPVNCPTSKSAIRLAGLLGESGQRAILQSSRLVDLTFSSPEDQIEGIFNAGYVSKAQGGQNGVSNTIYSGGLLKFHPTWKTTF